MSKTIKVSETKLNNFRVWSSAAAEAIDAWRIVPRLCALAYAALLYKLVTWFLNVPTFDKKECDQEVLAVLLNSIDLEQAQAIACTVVDVVGGPTTSQTAFVTVVAGLAAPFFAFYVNSGKNWSNKIEPWKWNEGAKEVETVTDENAPVKTPLDTPTEAPKLTDYEYLIDD